jgi:small-conductance mechanosensitive channel
VTFPETVALVVQQLDNIGFDYGSSRISVYRAIVALVVIIAVIAFGRFASRMTRRIFKRFTALDPTQQVLGEKLVSITVWIVTFLVGIDIIGIDLTALTVFSGAFGLAAGFGLQKTFGNLIAGIILLMDRSIKPGDVITVNDGVSNIVGQVKRIGIRAVSVTTRDKKEYLIPNENLMINQVENWSYSSRDVRIKVPVSVAYGTDIELAESLLLSAARAVPRVLERPDPVVNLLSISENAIHFEIRIWINDPEEGLSNVRSDVLKSVWRLFRDHDLRLPAPQQEVRVTQWPDSPFTVSRDS